MKLKTYLCALALPSALIGSVSAMDTANRDDFEHCMMTNNSQEIGHFFERETSVFGMPSQYRFDELFERGYEDNPTLAGYLLTTPDRYLKPSQESVDRLYQKAARKSDIHFMNRLSMTTLGTPKPSQSVINDVFRDQDYTDKTIARFILSTPSTVSKPTASQITDIFERAAQEEDAEFVAMLLTSPVHVPKPSRRVVSDVFCRSHDGSSNLRSFLLSIPNITYFLTPDAIRNVLREALMNQEFALIQQLIHADKGCLNAWKYELPKLMEETVYCGERSSTAAFVASLLNQTMDASALLQLDA